MLVPSVMSNLPMTLAGMCKCNVFGRLALSSGAQVPLIKGRSLLERFKEYCQCFPNQKAGCGYLESLASPWHSGDQDIEPEAVLMALTYSKAPRQTGQPKAAIDSWSLDRSSLSRGISKINSRVILQVLDSIAESLMAQELVAFGSMEVIFDGKQDL
jgi:hypothetical protein